MGYVVEVLRVKLKCDIHLVEGAARLSEPVANTKTRTNLLDLVPEQASAVLRAFVDREGLPAYRANQVLQHLWQQPRETFEAMAQLPAELRSNLDQEFEI